MILLSSFIMQTESHTKVEIEKMLKRAVVSRMKQPEESRRELFAERSCFHDCIIDNFSSFDNRRVHDVRNFTLIFTKDVHIK